MLGHVRRGLRGRRGHLHRRGGRGLRGGGVAAQAAGAVVPRWIDKLGGADVYTQANAYELVESLRIDFGHLGPFGIHP